MKYRHQMTYIAVFITLLCSIICFSKTAAQNGSTVSGAYAFPVPFKPSLGHTSITFINLPSEADIKVYAITGEVVRSIHHSDSTGTPGEEIWDVTNDEGQPLGSEVYYYVISSNGETQKGKLLVVR